MRNQFIMKHLRQECCTLFSYFAEAPLARANAATPYYSVLLLVLGWMPQPIENVCGISLTRFRVWHTKFNRSWVMG